jgi:hypothetical protein
MAYIPSAVHPSLSGYTAASVLSPKTPQKTIFPSKIMPCDSLFDSTNKDYKGMGMRTSVPVTRPLPQKKNCQVTFGQIAVAPNGKISLYFFREFLSNQLYRQHFPNGVFTMKEACPIPLDVAKKLNIKEKKLLPGDYSVIECGDHFRVEINCI